LSIEIEIEEDSSMTLTGAKEMGFEGVSPHRLVRGRRVVVVVLGAILAAVACAIIGAAFVQGSWWYSYGTDRALSHESRVRVEAIRDEMDASGSVPEAVTWLDAALDPHADPTTVRAYLLAVQETLGAADDPKLAHCVGELRAVIETIRPSHVSVTTTPRPMPTLEWPW
jgi:hypothetical protein